MVQLYSGKGAEAAAHLDLKKQARKSECFCFHSKRHFQNDVINDLWGILS